MLDLTFPDCSRLGLAVFLFACPKTMAALQLLLCLGWWWLLEAKVCLWTQGWVRAYENLLLTGMQNAVVGIGVARVGTYSCPYN